MRFHSSAALLSASLLLAACGDKKAPEAPPAEAPPATAAPTATAAQDPATLTYAAVTGVDISKMTKSPDGYYYQDLVVGTGPTAERGKLVGMDYTGWLADGTEFDSSVGKTPYAYTIGNGEVIQGWDLAAIGMKVGGKRLAVFPSAFGYGNEGRLPRIPGGAVLVFTMELKSVK